ncbi:MAG: hypothetical protein LUF92_16130 [Clostridiales bacterium]|nr:hypothetical protein [Clostridiales bacterium]
MTHHAPGGPRYSTCGLIPRYYHIYYGRNKYFKVRGKDRLRIAVNKDAIDIEDSLAAILP